MAHNEKSNSQTKPQDARPGDPKTNTRPRGNGDREQRDTERGRQKLEAVLGH